MLSHFASFDAAAHLIKQRIIKMFIIQGCFLGTVLKTL